MCVGECGILGEREAGARGGSDHITLNSRGSSCGVAFLSLLPNASAIPTPRPLRINPSFKVSGGDMHAPHRLTAIHTFTQHHVLRDITSQVGASIATEGVYIPLGR